METNLTQEQKDLLFKDMQSTMKVLISSVVTLQQQMQMTMKKMKKMEDIVDFFTINIPENKGGSC